MVRESDAITGEALGSEGCRSTRLLRPSLEYEREFLAMANEYDAEGDLRYADSLASFSAYLTQVDRHEQGRRLPKFHVRTSTFWLESEGEIVGGSRLRHSLNARLHRDGGNIGYDVRPTRRGLGLGHRVLALTLFEASRIGLERVLLTCAIDNEASLRVIRSAGGLEDGTSVSPQTGETMLRHWIDLSRSREDLASRTAE